MIGLRINATIVLIVAFNFICNAQWSNDKWLYGRWHNDTTWAWWGGTRLTFTNDAVNIVKDSLMKINIRGAYSGLETPDKQFFVYTNGFTLANKNHDTLINGSGLSPGGIYSSWAESGYPVPYSAILLPFPGSDTLMAMFHLDIFNSGTYGHAENLYYSLIDPSSNNGQGSVMIKNQQLVNDTLSCGSINALRHANGRDWWVIVRKGYLNDYYTYLLTPLGPQFVSTQQLPGPQFIFAGQGNFSPDGKWYACFGPDSEQFRLYQFDRCTGIFSNMQYKNIINEIAGSTIFSPNSRFIYINSVEHIWQFDLQASDIMASQTLIATLDTSFHDPSTGWVTGWCNSYLAQDDKIYVQNFSGVMLHVINRPDSIGQTCNFVQNQIQLPTFYYATVPTYVNLNLLQESGSVCDTLEVGDKELILADYKLRVQPNPASEEALFTFNSFGSDGNLYIYNMNGELADTEKLSKGSTYCKVNVSGFSRGLYIAQFVNYEGSLRIKFTVIK